MAKRIIKAYDQSLQRRPIGCKGGVHTPVNALSLNEKLIELRRHIREQDKEIRCLKDENEFLEEASAFFAASRRKPENRMT